MITGTTTTSGSVFSSGQVQPLSLSHGDITINLKAALGTMSWSTLAWEGALGRIWYGNLGDPFSSYTQVFEGSCGPHSRDNNSLKVTLFGQDTALTAVNLLTASYGGTGGLDGAAGLKGMLKPMAWGACTNIEAPEIDTAYIIYQVHGYGAVNDILKVYENAIDLGAPVATVPTTMSALQALTLTAGQWAKAPAIGCFRLGSQPTGKVTSDIQGALDSGTYITNVATIGAAILKLGGVASGKIDTTSLGAFSGYPDCRYYTDQISVGEAARESFEKAGGWLFCGPTGTWQAGNWFGTKTPIALNEDRSTAPQIMPGSIKLEQTAPPNYSVKIGYGRNFTVMSDSDISPAVADAQADILTNAAAASAAAAAAATAQAQANLAISRLNDIANDGILDRSEKAQINQMFSQLTASKSGLNAQATSLGITTENTNYNTAYSALSTYLSGLSPAYTDTTADTNITRTTWNTKWSDEYTTRQTLLNAIAAMAATKANWTNISSTPTPIAAVTNTTVIDNSTIVLNGSGQLNTGVTTLTPVIDNGKITVNGSGVLVGTGTSGVTVDNGKAVVSVTGLFNNGAGGSTQLSLSGMGLTDTANLVIGPGLNDPAIWQLASGTNNSVSSTILSALGVTSALNGATTTSAILDAKLLKPFVVEAGATYLFTVKYYATAGFNGYLRGQFIPMTAAGTDLTSTIVKIDYRPVVGASALAADTAFFPTSLITIPTNAVTARIEFDHGYQSPTSPVPGGAITIAGPRVQRQYSPGLVSLGDTVNLIPDPEFIDSVSWANNGAVVWQVLPNTGVGEGYGKNKVRITATTAPATGYTWYATKLMPVQPGRSYQASVYMKTVSGTTDVCRAWIQWFNAAGTSISVQDIVYNASGATGRFSLLLVAPSTATTANMAIVAGYQGTRVWEVSEPQFRLATQLGLNAVASDGTTLLTDSNTITANGTAAYIAGQGLGATANNLAGLDSTANTKLGGIATGATVGAIAGTNLKDSGGTVLGDSSIKNQAITIDASGNITNIGTSGVTVDNTKQLWTQVSGTGRPADGATVNRITSGTTAPTSPVDGDTWVDTSASPYVLKTRVAGAWVASANYVTNTNQVTDGAGLGTTATWTGVSSRPSNIAALTGSEAILNSGIGITSAGALTGGGGGSIAYDSLPNGSSYAKVLASELASGAVKLGVAGSGAVLGDQRNMPAVGTLNLRSRFTGQTVSYSASAGSPATATISVTAFTALMGSASISYSSSSVGVSGTGGTIVTYYLYFDDSGYTGGSKTLVATTNADDLFSSNIRVFVGSVDVTYPTTGTGGGTGGGGGGGGCVDEESWIALINDLVRAREVAAGDLVECASNDMSDVATIFIPATIKPTRLQPSYRLTTTSGATVVASGGTPMTLRDLSSVWVPDMLGKEALVKRDGALAWEEVTTVDFVGLRSVVLIGVMDGMYFAGEHTDAMIATHNYTSKP
ncbi:hypothetical protein QH494_02475 [Sphingomonas sp. AR_OL41]|uniref:beta strand repeat-containing protein n=1 Tax=Sphingomonas sp. AR_OL41 TaxID=3042729 RepID=UPI00248014A3|nr:hypothetical protein [Sphingomonas sp. AR_OL41]MDH7971034.1 hypothetical protein [Sphingomonas sp. AR_OL41]